MHTHEGLVGETEQVREGGFFGEERAGNICPMSGKISHPARTSTEDLYRSWHPNTIHCSNYPLREILPHDSLLKTRETKKNPPENQIFLQRTHLQR